LRLLAHVRPILFCCGILSLAVGCAGLPRSASPAILSQTVSQEREVTWSGVQQTICSLGGKLTLLDEDSGLCVFRQGSGFLSPRKWLNIYVTGETQTESAVYCFVHEKRGPSLSEADAFFFASLQESLAEKADGDGLTPSWVHARGHALAAEIVSPEWIRQGSSQSFPGSSFEEIWKASLLVCMQEGPLLYADKNSGIFVVEGRPRFSLLLKDTEPPSLFARRLGESIPGNDPSSLHWKTVLFYRLKKQIDAEKRWNALVGG